jgi:hypothetical protein
MQNLDRLVATLVGLRLAARKLPGKASLKLIELLVRRFEGKEDELSKRPAGSHEEMEWDTIGAHVVTTLNALGPDPDSGRYPLDEQARGLTSLESFRKWLRR